VQLASSAEPKFYNEVFTPHPRVHPYPQTHPFLTWLGTGLSEFLEHPQFFKKNGRHVTSPNILAAVTAYAY
jgi:hypothetical protein